MQKEGDQVKLDFPLFYYNDDTPLTFDNNDKLILLDYWYMSCPPCTKAAPYVNEMYQNYQSKGLKVIGINPIDDKRDKLDTFFKNKKIDYPVCLDVDKVTSKQFGVFAYPTFILLDAQGSIICRLDGFDKDEMHNLSKKIDVYLSTH